MDASPLVAEGPGIVALWALLFAAGLIQLCAIGFRTIDADITDIFAATIHRIPVSAVAPYRQFLLEGLLPNLLGGLLLKLGLSGAALKIVWIGGGYASLGAVVLLAIQQRRLTLSDTLLVGCVTRIVPTLTLWIGKSDPYLLAALLTIALFPRGAASRIAIPLAALCHPLATIVAVTGIYLTRWTLTGRRDDLLPALAVAGFVAAKVLGMIWLAPFADRFQLVAWTAMIMLGNGLHYSVLVFAAYIALPTLTIAALARPTRADVPGGLLPLLLTATWLLGTFLLGLYIALDHQRVMTLVTLPAYAMVIAVLGKRIWQRALAEPMLALALFSAFAAIPSLDGNGLDGWMPTLW